MCVADADHIKNLKRILGIREGGQLPLLPALVRLVDVKTKALTKQSRGP
jgi:hypothetical protein